jgi:hypothetical protein
MKTYGGVEVCLACHLIEESGQLHAPVVLPPGKEYQVPIT